MKQKTNLIIGILSSLFVLSCSSTPKENYPVALTPKGAKTSCLSYTADPNGELFISWAETKANAQSPVFYLSKWDDAKDTFSAPLTIPLEKNTSFNEQNKPMLAFQSAKSLWVIYTVAAPTKSNEYASFVHYRISQDGGQSWSSPKSLMNDSIQGRSNSFANALVLPDGKIAFAWMGGMLNMKRIAGRALYYTTTSGNGEFSKPILVDSYACPCCRNAMAVSPNGKVGIAYRTVREGNIRDVAFVFKPAGSDTFSRPVISDDQWQLDACPENGPSLVVTNDENWLGWYTGGKNKGIYYAKLDNTGAVSYKKMVDSTGQYIQLTRLSSGKNAVIYNSTMKMGGMNSSMIELSRAESGLLPPEELDTASYFATNPVLMPAAGSGSILTAWIAEGRVWYKKVD